MFQQQSLSYCGPAPDMASLWSRWNFDPLLLGAFALAALAALTAHRALTGRRRLWFWGAYGVLALAFVSPLCALTVALFSARTVHHLLLVVVAAPLLALAFPRRSLPVPLGVVFIVHSAIFWVWHLPAAYGAALVDKQIYWAMQVTLLGSGVVFWQGIFAAGAARGAVLPVLLGSIIQMGLLGALLTFAPQALYEPHLTTTLQFGLTPLEDQQLAGLLMWVPAALPYVAAALVVLAPLLQDRTPGRAGPP